MKKIKCFRCGKRINPLPCLWTHLPLLSSYVGLCEFKFTNSMCDKCKYSFVEWFRNGHAVEGEK